MIPAVGTVLKFVGSVLKIPSKALKTATKSIKSLPSKIQAAANSSNSEERGSLLGMIGRATDSKVNAKKLWNSLNRGFISKITKPLPNLKFVKPENLIQKTAKDQFRESARDKLERTKIKRDIKERNYHFNERHQDLKERWKQDRKQRNGDLKFEETYSPILDKQKDLEERQLHDYYDALLDQNISETDKIKAKLKFEQEKLNYKYDQLSLLQDSLNAIQRNFGKLAFYNENSFDAIQEQIAVSADITDNKQSFYNENLSSDLEILQTTNESNAELIVDAIQEGTQLQNETLNQLSAIEEHSLQRDSQIGEALESIEQQQKERHIQQMYVLNNLGAELMAVEQQQRAQNTEQAYIYNKFTKKQTQTKNSLFNMVLGGMMGILSSFLNALANPQQIVETMAETAGSFVAELLSTAQFVFANMVYGLGNVYAWTAKPIRALLSKILSEEKVNSILPSQDDLNKYMKIVDFLPNMVGLGMPNMVILPEPDMGGPMAGLFDRGINKLLEDPLKTIASLPEKAWRDITDENKNLWGKFKTFMSYALPMSAIPVLPLMPAMAPAIAARIIATAGMEDKSEPQKNNIDTSVFTSKQAQNAFPERAKGELNAAQLSGRDIDVKALESNEREANKAKNEIHEKAQKNNISNDYTNNADENGTYIDNSTTNNIFQTYVQQRDKQFASGV